MLALSSIGDVTTDYVVSAVEAQGYPILRVNTDDLLAKWSVVWRSSDATLRSEHAEINLANVRAVYFRRAYPPTPLDGTDREAWQFAAREARTMLIGLYAHLECPWISNFSAIRAAENKPRQLRLATRLGFNVPETVITTDSGVARSFIESGATVLKALSYGDLGKGKVLHTTLLSNWSDDFAADIEVCPVLLQRHIVKAADWRVTVVDDTVFCCRIDSQAHPEYALDMRRGLADTSMAHTLQQLSPDLESLFVELVRALGLRFGAIDIVEDTNGMMWFLEINPNGQWAWIEDRTGAPISSTIAKALVHG